MSTPSGLQESGAALVELGRLALLGRLVRGVVHELNNPLFVLLALSDLMLRAAEPGSQAAGRLAQMHESATELRALVAAFGALAREPLDRDAGPVAVELAPLLGATVALMRRVSLRKNVEIVERYGDEGIVVLARREELQLALLGLLADAQDAAPDAGRIEVAAVRRGDLVEVAVRRPGQRDGGGRPEPLASIVEAVLGDRGGTLRYGSDACGGSEAVLALPLHTDPAGDPAGSVRGSG